MPPSFAVELKHGIDAVRSQAHPLHFLINFARHFAAELLGALALLTSEANTVERLEAIIGLLPPSSFQEALIDAVRQAPDAFAGTQRPFDILKHLKIAPLLQKQPDGCDEDRGRFGGAVMGLFSVPRKDLLAKIRGMYRDRWCAFTKTQT